MNMSNMTPMDRVEYLLEQQRKAKEASEKKEVKQEVVDKKEEITLPQVSEPLNGLSLISKTENTKDNLIAKFSMDESDYSDIKLNKEEITKIKRVTGKMGSGTAASVPIICRGSSCTVKEKCLDGDTIILMSALSTKKIKDVLVGDKVYTLTDDLKLEKKVVTAVNITPCKVLYTIKTKAGSKLTLTSNHPLLLKQNTDYVWCSLDEGLREGDTILLVDALENDNLSLLVSEGDCVLDEIESITYNKVDTVYDITVKDNENYVANTFVVHNCPYYQMGKAPVGRDCLLEVMLAEYWTERYIDDLQIDVNSISEVQYLSRLVEISILEERLGKYISINQPDLMMDVVTAIDDDGKEIVNKASSISFEQKERLDRSKMKILESLNATRKEKLKIKQEQDVVDSNKTLLGLTDKLEALKKQFESTSDMKIVSSQ